MTTKEQLTKLFTNTDKASISFIDSLLDLCGTTTNKWATRDHITTWSREIFKAKNARKRSLMDRYIKNLATFIDNTNK